MLTLSHLLMLTRALFGRNATKPLTGGGHDGLTTVQVWCRASILLRLREQELHE